MAHRFIEGLQRQEKLRVARDVMDTILDTALVRGARVEAALMGEYGRFVFREVRHATSFCQDLPKHLPKYVKYGTRVIVYPNKDRR